MKKIFATLFTLLCYGTTSQTMLWAANVDQLGAYQIRHQRLSSDGILVSRPHPLDTFIMDFLRKNNIHNLNNYCHWLNENLVYQQEKSDAWTMPQDTINKMGGDCKDFAFLNLAVLRVLGYKPHILALVGANYGHAVCVFQENGYYFWFDNQRLVKTQQRSLDELADHLLRTTKATRLAELDPETRQWQIINKNS